MSTMLRNAYFALQAAEDSVDYSDPESINRWLEADWRLHAVTQRLNGHPWPEPYVPYDWTAARLARK